MFRLVNVKLIQREVVDAEGNLVPPWEMYDKLHPGTLVLIKVQLLTFELPDQQNDGIRKVPLAAPLIDCVLTLFRFTSFLLTASESWPILKKTLNCQISQEMANLAKWHCYQLNVMTWTMPWMPYLRQKEGKSMRLKKWLLRLHRPLSLDHQQRQEPRKAKQKQMGHQGENN